MGFWDYDGAFIYDLLTGIVFAQRDMGVFLGLDLDGTIHYQECGIVISGLVYLCI